jgi:diguanylate cyclase (GGDEF)-like protein
LDDCEALTKKNKKLTRKLTLLQETLVQQSNIKRQYDEALEKLRRQDTQLKELNDELERRVEERTIELQQAIEELSHIASTDALTKINNRMKFNILLDQKLQEVKRYNEEVGILFLDIDHFKSINDTHGHHVGDITLIELANVVQQQIRQSDIFARWGGEEFVVVLEKCSQTYVKQVAEQLRQAIEKHTFDVVGTVTCSFGVSMLQKEDSIEAIIKRVDQALYHAKESGRNRVSLMI